MAHRSVSCARSAGLAAPVSVMASAHGRRAFEASTVSPPCPLVGVHRLQAGFNRPLALVQRAKLQSRKFGNLRPGQGELASPRGDGGGPPICSPPTGLAHRPQPAPSGHTVKIPGQTRPAMARPPGISPHGCHPSPIDGCIITPPCCVQWVDCNNCRANQGTSPSPPPPPSLNFPHRNPPVSR